MLFLVPEAAKATARPFHTIYAIRGYNFSFERKYLDDGLKAMDQVRETLAKAEKLAGSFPHRVQLKDSLAVIGKAMAEYERLMGETEQTVAVLEKLATGMNDAAKKYMDDSSVMSG